MISWASKKLLNAGLAIALLATFTTVGFFNAPVSADAVTGEKGIANYSERWLRYRAIAACFSAQDVGGNDYDKIVGGTFLQRGNLADWKTTLGYLNSDGKVSCGDGSMVTNSMAKIGFADTLTAFCSMSTAERDGKKDYDNCVGGSGEFDMDGSRNAQYEAFRSAKAAKVADSAEFPHSTSDEKTKPILYWVGRESLVQFCGGKRGEKYDDSMAGNINDSKRKVVVNDVDLGTGKVVRYVYNLDRDEGDTINNVWAENGQDNSTDWAGDSVVQTKDMSCAALAQMTWEYDDAFGAFVTRYNIANPDDAGTGSIDDGEQGSNEPVCSAGALGWIICPAINFIASFNDMAYAAIQKMLIIEPTTVKIGEPLYNTWTKFRDIANVLFVIAFFVVIFSQATSVGLSSYGIKKLLPRVIAAAILVNLSFFICQIALDITNIVGVSIANLFEAMHSGSNVDVNVLSWQTAIGALLAGGAAYGGVVAILGTGGVIGAMAAILPFLVTALFAVVTAVAILIARQVIIILLIALAPLAFVAFILPNTQKYFQLWQNTFTTMLVMFPLIAALFAGSQLAANIVLTSNTTSDGIDFFQLIAAVCILFIPLFGVPYIVKFSGGAIGRLAGVINNPSKGPFDKLRKRAEGYRDLKQNQGQANALSQEGRTKNPFTKRVRRNAERDYRYSMAKEIQGENEQEYIARRALGEDGLATVRERIPANSKLSALRRPGFAEYVGGDPKYASSIKASAQSRVDKLFEQSVANAAILQKNYPSPRYENIAKGLEAATDAEQVAAARWVMQNGNFKQRKELYESIGTNSSEHLRQSVSTQFYAKGDNAILGSTYGGKLLEGSGGGEAGVLNAAAKQINDGKVTPQAMVHDADATKLLAEVAAGGYGVTPESVAALKVAANESLSNATTRTKALAENFSKEITKITGSTPPATQPNSGIIIPRSPIQPQNAPQTPTQQQRQQGGNFGGGPSQNLPPAAPPSGNNQNNNNPPTP